MGQALYSNSPLVITAVENVSSQLLSSFLQILRCEQIKFDAKRMLYEREGRWAAACMDPTHDEPDIEDTTQQYLL